ncbi:MAG: 3-phosphoshikimate 1-carboxyvinyltransferase [Allosphingosinicella sp.]|uniref:3-phosphoshikimate 1-carboxyvinyltransferase n=1 Tax=Allosphingosinicella sp. TaxID=2823234 RepID=UPI00395753FC
MREAGPLPMTFGRGGSLRGRARVPGDKSISHRALMLGAMALGTSRIEGLSEGGDVRSTAAALATMGAGIGREADGTVWVRGVGTGGLLQPERPLDMGNSGTSARLLMGLAASHDLTAILHGDASLSSRPMARVAEPLRRLGADIVAAPGTRLPIALRGLAPAAALTHRLDVPSAQVKSALLLAGLNIPGVTRLIETVPTRDHSERMLALFGADIRRDGPEIAIRGEAELRPQQLRVPGDPSAAAFLAVAALVVPGSELLIENVCVNPLRAGLFEVLRAMGGDIAFLDTREECGEPVADLRVRHSALTALDVPPEVAPSMIDEYPILFVAAAFAAGTTRTSGLAELRVKESDRLAAMAAGLCAIGVPVEESADGLAVRGSGGEPVPGGGRIDPRLDHRIAMSFAVAGLHAAEPVGIADMTPASTSWPGFADAVEALRR